LTLEWLSWLVSPPLDVQGFLQLVQSVLVDIYPVVELVESLVQLHGAWVPWDLHHLLESPVQLMPGVQLFP
jgi:hypothetical protein